MNRLEMDPLTVLVLPLDVDLVHRSRRHPLAELIHHLFLIHVKVLLE